MSMMLPDDPFDDTDVDRFLRLQEMRMELDRIERRNTLIMICSVVGLVLAIVFLAL